MRMPPLFFLPARERDWNAVEVSADGAFIAASVRAMGGRKPKVLSCAASSPTAMGPMALQDVAAKLPKASWTMVLPRPDYQMLVLPEPPVLEGEIASNLRWSLGNAIEYPATEASISWMRIPTAAFSPTAERQLYAVVARQSVVKEQTDLFAKANVALGAVDVRETALRNIAALASHEGEGVGLISLSDAGVSTVFTFRRELYLDRFIAQPADELADEQRRRKFIDRLASQIAQSLELIARSFPFFTVNRLLVAPSEHDIQLAQHLAPALPVSVEPLDLAAVFDVGGAANLANRATQGKYLVALGAALRGMK